MHWRICRQLNSKDFWSPLVWKYYLNPSLFSFSLNACNVLHNASSVAAKRMHECIKRSPIKQQNAQRTVKCLFTTEILCLSPPPIHIHTHTYTNISRRARTHIHVTPCYTRKRPSIVRDGDNKFYLLQRCSGRDSAKNRFTTKLEQKCRIYYCIARECVAYAQKTPLVKPRCNLAIIIWPTT